MSDTVLIGGVFDPLHAGHLAYIHEAKKYGPVMCVLSDAPQKHPPLVPLLQRAFMLSYLVRADCTQTIPEALRHYAPKYYIKGGDWIGKLPAEEVAICRELGITIIYTDTVTQSSSALLADYERRRNAEKLAAFEAFVSQQTPAEKPWEPVTDYSRETRREIEAPHADRIVEAFDLVGCRPRTVLDYGCGFGYLVELLRERGVAVHGWDPVYKPDDYVFGQTYDLVICREVLEHMPVGQLIASVRNLMHRSSKFVYVTTRFTAKSHLLDVDGSDDLDPTHITMLNQDLLRTLFVLEGCTRRPDLEEKLDHLKKGRVLVYEVPA